MVLLLFYEVGDLVYEFGQLFYEICFIFYEVCLKSIKSGIYLSRLAPNIPK